MITKESLPAAGLFPELNWLPLHFLMFSYNTGHHGQIEADTEASRRQNCPEIN